jgi:hypothetical protein
MLGRAAPRVSIPTRARETIRSANPWPKAHGIAPVKSNFLGCTVPAKGFAAPQQNASHRKG